VLASEFPRVGRSETGVTGNCSWLSPKTVEHAQYALYLALLVIGTTGAPLRAAFMPDDASVSAGLLFSGGYRYSSSGTYLETLGSDIQMGGGAFDRAGNFYLTRVFTNQVIDNGPEPPPGHLGAFNREPLYSPNAPGAPIVEYAPNGTLVRSLQTGPNGYTRDVKISPDEKTLYYSIGSSIQRIDLATDQPLSDFANVGGGSYEFQVTTSRESEVLLRLRCNRREAGCPPAA
jgi:hypothetical protein